MELRFRRYYLIILSLVAVLAFLGLVIGEQPVVAYTVMSGF